MIPTQYIFLEDIPRTVNGKPDKKAVKQLFMDNEQP